MRCSKSKLEQLEDRVKGKTKSVYNIIYIHIWLVVSTPLKNMSQNGNLLQIGVKMKKNETTTYVYIPKNIMTIGTARQRRTH